MPDKKTYACMWFDDLECHAFKTFAGMECWCERSEKRKYEDPMAPLTAREAFLLSAIGTK